MCPFFDREPAEISQRNVGWRLNGAVDAQQAKLGDVRFAAAALVVLSGLFYAAGNHEIGSLGVEMCRYGGAFCDNPYIALVGAGLAAAWAPSSAFAEAMA